MKTASINFPGEYSIWFPEEPGFFSSNEKPYRYLMLNTIEKRTPFSNLPALINTNTGIKIAISESDVEDYPGMWLQSNGNGNMQGIFAKYPLEAKKRNPYSAPVTKEAEYIARTLGTRTFPWRVMAVTTNDAQLLTNRLVHLLGQPCAIKDVSWIKPGKVSWDWWNAMNMSGVDFVTGINTATYKYYIDFASENNIEYIIMDEGWSNSGNVFEMNPDVDLPFLFDFAKNKNVGIIMWMTWTALDNDMEKILQMFEDWGVKGIKVDFMDRADQWMVNFYHRVAREAAKHKLMVDFHGAYKPDGLMTKYPNVISQEGVMGLEYTMWSHLVTPEHNVTIPFIRMWAGPADYTPGAMRNASAREFFPNRYNPFSQGTRCHQLAMFVIYDSPLQMMADHPANYKREKECLEFISKVPSVWDTTIVLDARAGDYILLARKTGNTWY
ncbi:MAG: glycoside hydrolase family 97 protein [Bacteroidales bacterium]|nr:glycoside hydrolase family 97 protein [Bacteroidales bacterium]